MVFKDTNKKRTLGSAEMSARLSRSHGSNRIENQKKQGHMKCLIKVHTNWYDFQYSISKIPITADLGNGIYDFGDELLTSTEEQKPIRPLVSVSSWSLTE